jgi:putative N6-adenine-specific DNA methylase
MNNTYFAVTAPGLEPFTARELLALGLKPVPAPEEIQPKDNQTTQALIEGESDEHILPGSAVQTGSGGVTFKGGLEALYSANLHLRTASRILVRLGNFFHATTFPELQERASRLPWELFLTSGQPIAMRITCHNSKLYHSNGVGHSVYAGLAERMGQASPLTRTNQLVDGQPPQLIIVRLADDKCTVSLDSSGDLLHKRGYRQAVAKAPLRENLAAALLMASGWVMTAPLLDPFCGSGTIPVEAALMALKTPPGLKRRFCFMDWPNYDEGLWLSIKNQAQLAFSMVRPIILASDRDAGAIQMAHENAGRAGVDEFIEFKHQAVSAITPPPSAGWVVTNPPYGLRISQGKDLRNLYARFGDVLRMQCPGWQVAVLCNDRVLLGQMRFDLDTSLGFVNGGVPVRIARGKVN